MTGDGFGQSQEVVGSASSHVGLTAAGGGVKLKAEGVGGEVSGRSVISDFKTF